MRLFTGCGLSIAEHLAPPSHQINIDAGQYSEAVVVTSESGAAALVAAAIHAVGQSHPLPTNVGRGKN
jgi:hypothetical protein